jgi:hypothetical protein
MYSAARLQAVFDSAARVGAAQHQKAASAGEPAWEHQRQHRLFVTAWPVAHYMANMANFKLHIVALAARCQLYNLPTSQGIQAQAR